MRLKIVSECNNAELLSQLEDNYKKQKKEEDETLIRVLTGMGTHAGTFFWPTEDLDMLVELNKQSGGFLFKWDGVNWEEIRSAWPTMD